jgi:hypothetical protein
MAFRFRLMGLVPMAQLAHLARAPKVYSPLALRLARRLLALRARPQVLMARHLKCFYHLDWCRLQKSPITNLSQKNSHPKCP